MKPVIGIFNSESKAKEAIESLKVSGLKDETIELINKYSLKPGVDDYPVYVDPNANIFTLDHNGLDVPLGEEISILPGNMDFANRMKTILPDIGNTNDLQATIKLAEAAGYIVVVQTESPGDYTKASDILKPLSL